MDSGLISRKQLDEALSLQADQGGKVAELLIALGHMDHSVFLRFLARQPGVASIDLLSYDIAKELVALVPKELAVKHEVFPIDKLGKLLTLGMACPLDARTIAEIQEVTGLKVKPLLCSSNDIRGAINRHYPADRDYIYPIGPQARAVERRPREPTRASKPKSVNDRVRELKSLPALPETVQRVRESTVNPATPINEVYELVALDPAVAAKVLSVANSAAYGFPGHIDNIGQAVALIGLRETYSIVLSSGTVDLLKGSKTFDYRIFWMESMCCAAASKVVAKACGLEKENCAFSAGLLRDIGRIALLEVAPERYAQVGSEIKGADLIAAEESQIGLVHTEAGYELAMQWSLPPEIAEAIRYHHQPERAATAREVVASVAIAETLIQNYGLENEQKEKRLVECEGLFDSLGLGKSAAHKILEEIAMVERTRFLWARKWKTFMPKKEI